MEGQIKTKMGAKEVLGLDMVADMPGQFVGLLRVGGKASPFPYSQVCLFVWASRW